MQFKCKNEGIDFRIKDFTGKFEGKDDLDRPFSITYGDYSKYPGATFSNKTSSCLCRSKDLLIGPNGDIYKCHRDLYAREFPLANILEDSFEIKNSFNNCSKFGNCHPCDVKVKTSPKQKLGHTSVEIKFKNSKENE